MDDSDSKRLGKIETSLAVQERELEHRKKTAEKAAEAIEKLTTISVAIKTMLAAHEQQISNNHELIDRLDKKLDKIVVDIEKYSQTDSHLDESVNRRLLSLERWRWTTIGGAAVVSFFIGVFTFLVFNVENLGKLFDALGKAL